LTFAFSECSRRPGDDCRASLRRHGRECVTTHLATCHRLRLSVNTTHDADSPHRNDNFSRQPKEVTSQPYRNAFSRSFSIIHFFRSRSAAATMFLLSTKRGASGFMGGAKEGETPLNVNCLDSMGRSALEIAVDNENIEVGPFMINFVYWVFSKGVRKLAGIAGFTLYSPVSSKSGVKASFIDFN
ncbi:hypothetical protein COOONC_13051, partial [Cooperia oncophora]